MRNEKTVKKVMGALLDNDSLDCEINGGSSLVIYKRRLPQHLFCSRLYQVVNVDALLLQPGGKVADLLKGRQVALLDHQLACLDAARESLPAGARRE